MAVHRELTHKTRRHRGQIIVPNVERDKAGNAAFNAIVKDGSITLFGHAHNHARLEGKHYQRKFVIGDQAEYDSWNLIYIGHIVKITDKCVTIAAYKGTRSEKHHRLSLYQFARKNWDFDLASANKHNSEESMYL